MKLIPNWKSAFKLSSVQLGALAVGCDAAFVIVSVIDEKWPMNPIWYAGIRMALTIASMLARIVRQDFHKMGE